MNRQQLQSAVALSLFIVGLLVSTVLAGQRGTPAVTPSGVKPLRIGVVGMQLTDQEVADLLKLLPAGGPPWLINGDPDPFGIQTQRFQVYMPPISATAQVRHGVAITVSRPNGSSSAWSIVKNSDGQPQTLEYAQVAIAGRPFDQVLSENDTNRPFVAGSAAIDDIDLVSLVTFVRSQGWGPIAGVAMHPPTEMVQRGRVKSGEVSATIRQTSTQGVSLALRKVGQSWEITSKFEIYN